MVAQPMQVLKQSVQERPEAGSGGLALLHGTTDRGPILPTHGTYSRELHLRRLSHHDYNLTFRSTWTNLTKQIIATPWKITSTNDDAEVWQALLMGADFGGWQRFVSKLVLDYGRQDAGGYIEIIGPGRPDGPLTAAVTGIAVLDSLRCYPTGDPEYPVYYYDINGVLHKLHCTRVVQFVDSPESDEQVVGFGTCALSRAASAVHREILMGRYLEQYLDDKPTPGILAFGNIGKEEVNKAMAATERDLTQDQSRWGRIITLYSLEAEHMPKIESHNFSQAPEKFDFEQYTMLNAREIALAIGVDFQDVWGELTSSSLGSGQQSVTLERKARGKTLGVILKELERIINNFVLPDYATFEWEAKDPNEDSDQAAVASQWASTVMSLMSSGVVNQKEARHLLADKMPGALDVLTDDEGEVEDRNDSDVVPEEDAEQILTDDDGGTGAAQTERAAKSFLTTGARFERDYMQFVKRVEKGEIGSQAAAKVIFRNLLAEAGRDAYEDGVREGGANPDEAPAEVKAARSRKVGEWVATQSDYINNMVVRLFDPDRSSLKAEQRNAQAWVAKSLRTIYHAGLAEVDSKGLYIWVMDPDAENCATCKVLNGQVHSLKTYHRAGFWPGSGALDCEGHCKCHLKKAKPTDNSRGRLPGRGIFQRIGDRFTDLLTRLTGEGRVF